MKKYYKAPRKGIFLEVLAEMSHDKCGMHATGRRIYAGGYPYDEYINSEGELFYK